jgi:two-component system LytT family sensor kinase
VRQDNKNSFLMKTQRLVPTYRFWVFQIIGWLAYGIMVYIAVVAPTTTSEKIVSQIQNLSIEVCSGFMLTLCLRLLFQCVWFWPIRSRVIVSLISVVTVALIWTELKISGYRYLRDLDIFAVSWAEFGAWYLTSVGIMLAWSSLYYGVHNYFLLLQAQLRSIQAESVAKDAQLKMLRYQLNPHFMFNAMNAISTLVLKSENEKANHAINELCKLLHHSLDSEPTAKVSLNEELDTLNLYLSIEKIRFTSRLEICLDVSESVGNALVPSFLLQPLFENSIKHAVAPSIKGGRISLVVLKVNDLLLITLKDSGVDFEVNSSIKDVDFLVTSKGIGLKNTRERLNVMYPDTSHFEAGVIAGEGFQLQISIPFELADASG